MKRIEGFTKGRSCYSIQAPWLKEMRVRDNTPLDSEEEQGVEDEKEE